MGSPDVTQTSHNIRSQLAELLVWLETPEVCLLMLTDTSEQLAERTLVSCRDRHGPITG